MKNTTEKLLSVTRQLSDTLLKQKLPGQNSTVIHTNTLSVSVSKVAAADVAKQPFNLESFGQVAKLEMPPEFALADNGSNIGLQVGVLSSVPESSVEIMV